MSPSKGINEASFYIRVKDSARLDYEAIKVVNMTLVAREVVAGGRESRVGVVVYLRNQNNNGPMFSRESYEVWVGTEISQVKGNKTVFKRRQWEKHFYD